MAGWVASGGTREGVRVSTDLRRGVYASSWGMGEEKPKECKETSCSLLACASSNTCNIGIINSSLFRHL